MTTAHLRKDDVALADFCRRWKIKELAVFGSAVRGDIRPDSDIDLLVTFAPEINWTMFDHYRMEDELAEMFAREVGDYGPSNREEYPAQYYYFIKAVDIQ